MKKQKEKKPAGTGFLIQKIHYEYNDEYYYRTDQDSGIPVKFFLNEKDALKSLIQETVKHVKDWSCYRFQDFENAYELVDEVLSNIYANIKTTDPERVKQFPSSKVFLNTALSWDSEFNMSFFTDEEIIQLLDELKIKLFYIQEVDIYE